MNSVENGNAVLAIDARKSRDREMGRVKLGSRTVGIEETKREEFVQLLERDHIFLETERSLLADIITNAS